MTRSLAALVCFGAALLGAPAHSEAGVIPWMYDAIFGYGHPSGGWGYGGGGTYGGYTTGYAPFYTASYGGASYGGGSYGGGSYGGGNCCGSTANYAPWTGYSYGSSGDGCCSPCGAGGCNPCGGGDCGSDCGTSCDPSCGNHCPGGNCGTSSGGTSSGTSAVPSRPSDQGAGQNPTYAPPITNDRTPPRDQFGPADRNRGGVGTGSSVPPAAGFGAPAGGPPVDPNANSAPGFAPGEPAPPRPGRRNEDSRHVPQSPLTGGEKVAFKTPAKFSRTSLQPVFELPTIVSAPPRTIPEPTAAPTAMASK